MVYWHFERPFIKRFTLCYRCLSYPVLPVCLSVTLVYCGQTVERIKMQRGMQVGLGPGHIVLDGDPAPLPKKGRSPQFSAHICCGQIAGWIKMPLGMEVGLSPSDILLDGDPAPPPQKLFLVHVYCGQRAGWIKMPLGMKVGLNPSDIALDGDPAPRPPKGHTPQFLAHICCGQMAPSMGQVDPSGVATGLHGQG